MLTYRQVRQHHLERLNKSSTRGPQIVVSGFAIIILIGTVLLTLPIAKVGASEVVLPEHEAGVRLARRLSAIDFVDFMELSEDKGVVEIVTPRRLIGKSLRESQIRQQYGLAVVAIRREGDVIISPRAEDVIKENDILVVLGRIANCEKLREEPFFTGGL